MKILQLLLISLSLMIPIFSYSEGGRVWELARNVQLADVERKTALTNNQALHLHNQIRTRERQRPLKVNKDLTKIAQKWANQLARSCKMHHQKNAPFGENIGWSGGPSNINKIIQAWANEKKNYNLKQNTCPKGKQCYHYTQMVWAGTTDIGCAKQRCANGKGEIYVCNYFPAGNIVGARPFKP